MEPSRSPSPVNFSDDEEEDFFSPENAESASLPQDPPSPPIEPTVEVPQTSNESKETVPKSATPIHGYSHVALNITPTASNEPAEAVSKPATPIHGFSHLNLTSSTPTASNEPEGLVSKPATPIHGFTHVALTHTASNDPEGAVPKSATPIHGFTHVALNGFTPNGAVESDTKENENKTPAIGLERHKIKQPGMTRAQQLRQNLLAEKRNAETTSKAAESSPRKVPRRGPGPGFTANTLKPKSQDLTRQLSLPSNINDEALDSLLKDLDGGSSTDLSAVSKPTTPRSPRPAGMGSTELLGAPPFRQRGHSDTTNSVRLTRAEVLRRQKQAPAAPSPRTNNQQNRVSKPTPTRPVPPPPKTTQPAPAKNSFSPVKKYPLSPTLRPRGIRFPPPKKSKSMESATTEKSAEPLGSSEPEKIEDKPIEESIKEIESATVELQANTNAGQSQASEKGITKQNSLERVTSGGSGGSNGSKKLPFVPKARESPPGVPTVPVPAAAIAAATGAVTAQPETPSGESPTQEAEQQQQPEVKPKQEGEEGDKKEEKDGTEEQPAEEKGVDPREDKSTRLLNLCKRGEWILVDNLLRYAEKSKLNLAMTDEHGFTALMLVLKEGRTSVVERMLDLGANINAKTKDGRTVAHIAAMYAKDDMIRFLISRKVDLTVHGGPKGQLPLHYACSRPSGQILSMVQLLLRSTVVGDKDSRLLEDKNGCIPLHLACENSNLVVCKELLTHIADKQTRLHRKDTGETPLHLACKQRNVELARLLVDYGAVPNVQDHEGLTPLHVVAAEGDESLLRILYNMRADANLADKEDRTPLHVAAEHGHTNVVEILTDKFKASVMARTKDGSTLMHIASKNGHSQTAIAFLKRGVPLQMPNKTGALGLHCAAAMGHVAVVTTLLSKGTHVDTRTKENYTALHVAVQSGKPDVVECLLGHGADVHIKGGRLGETALHIAAGLQGKDGKLCAEMLLKSGAEPNIRQENGETALHIAARRGNPAMIKLLLSEESDPMAVSKVGETPLHVAARYCHLEACKILLQFVEETFRKEESTMLVNQQTTEGETAMHFAAEITNEQLHFPNEDGDIVNLLLETGGDVNLQTQMTSETVMHYCARSGNENVLQTVVTKIGPGAVQIALNKQSKNGWSPLLESCSKGHLGIVKILLANHARVDVFDEHGKTGLHLAAENGHAEIADVLLKNKAFINSKSKLGVTPLHQAAMYGHNKVVTLLVQEHHAALEAVTLESRTPLHFSAKQGQLAVASTLLTLGANANARDVKGQTPLHLAAENDHPEVVKLFLKQKTNLNALTATDENGFTCAHIAAMKGSIAVVKELMMIDKAMVIDAKTKTTESTAMHMAAAGGHKNIVKYLLGVGSNPEDENANGMTALHLAAKNGHTQILDVIDKDLWRKCSKRTGLNPLHVAAYYGQIEFVRTMLSHLPATARSEPPLSQNPLIVKELATEYGLTPLHMAAQSGHEGLVRLLLNFAGVQVDAVSATMNVIPLHLAAQMGNISVVGMLLSRSTQQLHIKDSRGRTALHLASMNGHYDMVSLLIAQGSNINAMDQNGWTGLHFATKAGHMNVMKLLLESSADPQAETRDGKIPMCFAASHNHVACLSYLMSKEHDTHLLMEDKKFIFDLMVCGKSHENKPVEEFVLRSPAPIDTAVKMSTLYKELSEKEKERARDLLNVALFCENMAVELLSIISIDYSPSILLKAHDQRGRPFLDILIENEQKEVVSHASVQRYLTEVWSGGITWGFGKFIAFFFLLLLCPPAWIFFSLPMNFKMGRAPIIKFICHLISHVYFSFLLALEVLNVIQKVYQVTTIWPNWLEWLVLFWLSGILVAELSSFGGRSGGLGMIRLIMLFLSALALLLHVIAFLYPFLFMKGASTDDRLHTTRTILYAKNQLFAFVLLFAFVQFLDYLTVHHLFGPWAIIIRDIMYDLARFLVILILFTTGFTLHITSIFQPAYQEANDGDAALMRMAQPQETLEMLFFALFGLVSTDNMPPLDLVPDFSQIILKVVFGLYMLVIFIVLINLLIAMMSDTYQRIQSQSDTEWKFGRAKLIRQMNKKSATPAPIIIVTKFYTLIKVAIRNRLNMCTMAAQEDLRHEENIDAFAVATGQTGRHSPTPKLAGGQELGEEHHVMETVELGVGGILKIEQAIGWKRVVETFYLYQGGNDGSTETRDNTGPADNLDDDAGSKDKRLPGAGQTNADVQKG